jgi:hypothetical protein
VYIGGDIIINMSEGLMQPEVEARKQVLNILKCKNEQSLFSVSNKEGEVFHVESRVAFILRMATLCFEENNPTANSNLRDLYKEIEKNLYGDHPALVVLQDRIIVILDELSGQKSPYPSFVDTDITANFTLHEQAIFLFNAFRANLGLFKDKTTIKEYLAQGWKIYFKIGSNKRQ